MDKLLSGKAIAHNILEHDLIPRVEKLIGQGITPKLVVLLIGNDTASESYVRQKEKAALEVGIEIEILRFSENVEEGEIFRTIEKLNGDDSVHGFFVQFPVPRHLSREKITASIDPQKDVDGLSAQNLGELFQGKSTLQCCTPKGILTLLEHESVEIAGKHAVVIGRSNNVGKPVATLLLQKNATVTVCHSHTNNLEKYTQQADILVVAVGKPEFLHGDSIKEGCIVIDVGIHHLKNGKICGDVHFESASKKASKITPVPGGVGPMTVVSLMENTIQVAENRI